MDQLTSPDAGQAPPPSTRICSIKDCPNRLKARGWCGKHYMRFRVHGDPEVLLVRERTGVRSCAKCLRTPADVPFKTDRRAPDGLGAYCRPCGRDYDRAVAPEKRDQYRAAERARYAADPQRRLEQNRAWRAANLERALEARRARPLSPGARARHNEANQRWRSQNPGYFSAWYDANQEHARQSAREWRRRNKDTIAAQSARRRMRMIGVDSRLNIIDRQAAWERDGGICGLCALPVEFDAMHLDHIKPIAKGGLHAFDNVQPSHGRCNRRKRDRELPKWAFATRTPEPR